MRRHTDTAKTTLLLERCAAALWDKKRENRRDGAAVPTATPSGSHCRPLRDPLGSALPPHRFSCPPCRQSCSPPARTAPRVSARPAAPAAARCAPAASRSWAAGGAGGSPSSRLVPRGRRNPSGLRWGPPGAGSAPLRFQRGLLLSLRPHPPRRSAPRRGGLLPLLSGRCVPRVSAAARRCFAARPSALLLADGVFSPRGRPPGPYAERCAAAACVAAEGNGSSFWRCDSRSPRGPHQRREGSGRHEALRFLCLRVKNWWGWGAALRCTALLSSVLPAAPLGIPPELQQQESTSGHGGCWGCCGVRDGTAAKGTR